MAFTIYQNNGIRNKLEAWLIFLSNDNPEIIVQLITTYPEFRKMYEDVYDLCMNTERVMNMFSKELQQLDKNTVQYMIDEMQDEIDAQKVQIDELSSTVAQRESQLQDKDAQLQEKDSQLQDKDAEIAVLKERIQALTSQA